MFACSKCFSDDSWLSGHSIEVESARIISNPETGAALPEQNDILANLLAHCSHPQQNWDFTRMNSHFPLPRSNWRSKIPPQVSSFVPTPEQLHVHCPRSNTQPLEAFASLLSAPSDYLPLKKKA